MTKRRILCLSNGHGEDLNATLVIRALRRLDPTVRITAMPIVGEGQAYRKLGIPIIGPTESLPSGGFNYINFARFLNPRNWVRDKNPISLGRDLVSGLVILIWRQWRATCRHSRTCDLLFATGDIVPILFALLTSKPFVVFLVSTSAYYEGHVKLPLILKWGLRSRRCQKILTRDGYTARDLQQRGFHRAVFAGYPIMDTLTPTGKAIKRNAHCPLIALLPGSRLPEARQNLGLMLRLCQAIAARCPAQFEAALVPKLDAEQVQTLAQSQGWQTARAGALTQGTVTVGYHYGLFADILHHCDLVVGMAGTAVEQAVGLGKPVVQIPGAGPQFTYLFAEAQMRLLGISVVTVGDRPADQAILETAADRISDMLADTTYLKACVDNGQERVGLPGGSEAIAQTLLATLAMLQPPLGALRR
jgi:uncharacterized protein (TIGR03492 family)